MTSRSDQGEVSVARRAEDEGLKLCVTTTGLRYLIGTIQDEAAELTRMREQLRHLERDNARLDREVGRLNSALRSTHMDYHRSLNAHRLMLFAKRVKQKDLPALPLKWDEGVKLCKDDDDIPF